MKTATTNIPPSHPPKTTTPLLKHPRRSIYQNPAVHQNGWFITATRMFQRAEGRAVFAITVVVRPLPSQRGRYIYVATALRSRDQARNLEHLARSKTRMRISLRALQQYSRNACLRACIPKTKRVGLAIWEKKGSSGLFLTWKLWSAVWLRHRCYFGPTIFASFYFHLFINIGRVSFCFRGFLLSGKLWVIHAEDHAAHCRMAK